MGSSPQNRRSLRALASLAFLATSGSALADCALDRVDLRGDWGQARFSVEVADDAEERSLGLMHRETMPRSAGMLFAYESPQYVAFWMRNTLIPLDMIFMDNAGVVQRVHENAIPLDETSIEGGESIQYVLEMNGGLAGRQGISPGTVLRSPVIGSKAAWPCE